MPNKLVLGGFDQLRDELVSFPQTINRESAPILERYARATQAIVISAYPIVTGALRAGVRVIPRGARGVATLYTLITSAPHAHIYEFGSRYQRPRPTFLPITERGRRDGVVAVADLVASKGLVVRGARD